MTCYPEVFTETFPKTFLDFASRTCWEMSFVSNTSQCMKKNDTDFSQIDYGKLETEKTVMKVFPLLLFAQVRQLVIGFF